MCAATMSKRRKTKKVTVKEEDIDVDTKYQNGAELDNFVVPIPNDDVIDWPESDLLELLKKIESNIPDKDTLRYDSRVEKLDWDTISFGNYSGQQCKDTWYHIQKRLRRYRLLRELLDDAKTWVNKPWTNFYRSQKQNRHPGLPKRPLSTYMLFYMEKKDEVARQNPGMDMTTISKLISVNYNQLSEKKKRKYVEMAATQRHEYEQKLKKFYEEHPELVPKVVNAKENKQAQSEGPKKPSTPFKIFLASKISRQKTDDGEFDRVSFTNKCKKQWQEMSDKKKVIWINWALEEETKYKEQLQLYMSENPDFVPGPFKSVLTKEERNLLERIAGKPEKPPNSGYSLFSRIMLVSPEIKLIPAKERMSEISRLWKSLDEDGKAKYQEQVNHMLDQYKLEYATYLESLPEEKRQEELLSNQGKRKVAESKTEPKAVKKKKKKEVPEVKSNVLEGEPEPPPSDPFRLFSQMLKANAKKENKVIHDADIIKAWQTLPDVEKSKFRKQLREMKQKYAEDFEKFLKSLSQEELKKYSLQNRERQSQEISDNSISSSGDSSDDQSDSDDSSSGSSSDSDDSSTDDDGDKASSSSSDDSE